MLYEIPNLFHPLLHRVAEIGTILGPDWHLNVEGHHVSWRYRDTDMFPIAIDFTNPAEVQMYDMDESDFNPAVLKYEQIMDLTEIRQKIGIVTKHCSDAGIKFGLEQA